MPDLVLAEFPETKGCTEAGEPGGGGIHFRAPFWLMTLKHQEVHSEGAFRLGQLTTNKPLS